MSTELKGTPSITGEVMLTRYWGGAEAGTCLQLTPPVSTYNPYLSLTKSQALEMIVALSEFVNDCREERE